MALSVEIRGCELSQQQVDAIVPVLNMNMQKRMSKAAFEQACVDAMTKAGVPLLECNASDSASVAGDTSPLSRDAIVELIQASLVEAGWTNLDAQSHVAIATRSFHTAVGTKEAHVYFSKGDGYNFTLSGNYLSEGKNALEGRSVLIPVGTDKAGVKALARKFAVGAVAEVHKTYAMRLMPSNAAVGELKSVTIPDGVLKGRGGTNHPGVPDREGQLGVFRSPYSPKTLLVDVAERDRYGRLSWVALSDEDPRYGSAINEAVLLSLGRKAEDVEQEATAAAPLLPRM